MRFMKSKNRVVVRDKVEVLVGEVNNETDWKM